MTFTDVFLVCIETGYYFLPTIIQTFVKFPEFLELFVRYFERYHSQIKLDNLSNCKVLFLSRSDKEIKR